MSKKVKLKKLTEKFREAAASNSKRVHVVPSEGAWAVKKEGSKRAAAVKKTKAAAVIAANSMKSAERVIVHKKDGTIQTNTKKK
jgi:hypothetical protein